MKNTFKIMMFFITLSLPLVGCGIKPNSVDAPTSAEKPDNFPRTYPASK